MALRLQILNKNYQLKNHKLLWRNLINPKKMERAKH